MRAKEKSYDITWDFIVINELETYCKLSALLLVRAAEELAFVFVNQPALIP